MALIGFIHIINRNYILHKLPLLKGNTSSCPLCRKNEPINDCDPALKFTHVFLVELSFYFSSIVICSLFSATIRAPNAVIDHIDHCQH